MSAEKPDFFLREIAGGSASDRPSIVPLKVSNPEQLSRRRFLEEGIAVSAILSVINGADADAGPRISRGTIYAHFGRINNLTISRDGKTLASASDDGTVKLWDLPAGKRRTVYDYTSPVLSVCLSADGKWLLSGHQDTKAKLRTMEKPDELPLEFNALKPVVAVRFTEDPSRFASMAADGFFSLWERRPKGRVKFTKKQDEIIGSLGDWNVPAGLQTILRNNVGSITGFHLTPDATKLAYAAAKKIGIWKLPEGELIKLIDQPSREMRLMIVASQASVLAYLAPDNVLGILHYETADDPIVIRSASKWITCIAITPDGSLLVTGHSDGAICLWDATTGDQLGYCFDSNCNWQDGKSYGYLKQLDVVYTLPCGSAIPKGAKCTCNCVPGTAREYFVSMRQQQILDLQMQQRLEQWASQQRLRERSSTTKTTVQWVCTCDLVYY